MPDEQFAAFMAGGMAILVAASLAIAWILWRERDSRIDRTAAAIEGIGHEYRINVQRMITELAMMARGELPGPSALIPISHPQLDGVNAGLIETNRKALAVMNASYLELTSRKEQLREGIINRTDISQDLGDAIHASIDALTTLYLWEEHKGVSPHEARSTRSWEIRDWMKEHRFQNDAFPGLHLRDQVVERLRDYNMELTPRPLSHTAHEYYSMQYDRYADPRSPFGRRKLDEDGNVVPKEPRKKVSDRLKSAAAGIRNRGKGNDDEPSAEAVREGRLAKIKRGLSRDEESKFSFGRLSDKVRGRNDSTPPSGE